VGGGIGGGLTGYPYCQTLLFQSLILIQQARPRTKLTFIMKYISKENYKTNVLRKNQINVDTDTYLNSMLKMS
jgi:hypothetical protein